MSWHSPACQNKSSNCWYVPPCHTIISKVSLSPSMPQYILISGYQASLHLRSVTWSSYNWAVSTIPEYCVNHPRWLCVNQPQNNIWLKGLLSQQSVILFHIQLKQNRSINSNYFKVILILYMQPTALAYKGGNLSIKIYIFCPKGIFKDAYQIFGVTGMWCHRKYPLYDKQNLKPALKFLTPLFSEIFEVC